MKTILLFFKITRLQIWIAPFLPVITYSLWFSSFHEPTHLLWKWNMWIKLVHGYNRYIVSPCFVTSHRACRVTTINWMTWLWVNLLTFFVEVLFANILLRVKVNQMSSPNVTLIAKHLARHFLLTKRFLIIGK